LEAVFSLETSTIGGSSVAHPSSRFFFCTAARRDTGTRVNNIQNLSPTDAEDIPLSAFTPRKSDTSEGEKYPILRLGKKEFKKPRSIQEHQRNIFPDFTQQN
jgi:hypothetical protein